MEKQMKSIFRHALTVAGLAIAAQAGAQVTFYEEPGYQGRSFTTQTQVRNFDRFGFNDRASSVVVQSSRWEVCDDTRFDGNCVVLRPGRYPSLAAMGLNDRISSVRAISANARIDDDRYAPLPVASQITFYDQQGFQGRSFTTAKEVANLERFGFNDRASSVEVIGDRWEACEDARFGGRCVVLRPGRYASMEAMGLNNRVSSVRTVSSGARIADNRYAPDPLSAHDGRDYRRRNEERVYEANVTSARAVVATPGQRCWVEPGQAVAPTSNISVPGAVVGAVLGGILGHQVGKGTGRDVATVGGAALGGFAGANVGKLGIGQQAAQPQNVQRCENVPSQVPTYWDVTYNFKGVEHRVQMTSQPGSTIPVNEQGEPRT